MRKFGNWTRRRIIQLIDLFYWPFFKRNIPESVFRYIFCGSANVLFDWFLFFVFYNFVFQKQLVHVSVVTITPYISAFICTFPITFVSGFLLSKYISFNGSLLRGRVQFLRYFLVVVGCILINYFGLKLFVGEWNFYPTPAKMVVTLFTTLFSYVMQSNFTFQHHKSLTQ
jgi:putative flippase GtrA